MKRIEIYEPAGCAAGACDPMLERTLTRIEHMIQDLRERGVSVSRFNVMDDGPAFLASDLVKEALATRGLSCLPLVIVEGRIESEGEYPTDLELAKWAGLPWSELEVYAEREKRELGQTRIGLGGCEADEDCDGDCGSCS
jgi:hypothetical protein